MLVGFTNKVGGLPWIWARLVVGLVTQGCLPALPEPNPEVPVACGNEGEPCCGAGVPACGAALLCNVPSGTCVSTGPRYCTSNDQCEAGQSCCVSGLIGSCVEGAPGLACPQADLQVEMSQQELGLSIERRDFYPPDAVFGGWVQDACAIEKLCVGGYGERRLLHFSAAVRNVGNADLLFGSSSTASFTRAACDGQPYYGNYLSYSLVDAEGEIQASGQKQAGCDAQSVTASGFDCQFNGIEHGSSQLYPGRPLIALYDNARRAGVDVSAFGFMPATDDICQWLDVTNVAPGNYLLRIQVNADGRLAEGRLDNNRIEFPVTLPNLDDPTQVCPTDDDAGLLGYGWERECGWVATGPTSSCTPRASVTVGCAACSGAPLLRVCEGSPACPLSQARAYNTPFDFIEGCPELVFECPESGRYGVYQAPPGEASAQGVACTLTTTP